MTRVYFDTGVLVKLYYREPNSADAMALVNNFETPLPLGVWQELEVRTALRSRAFRGELSQAKLQAILQQFDADISGGVFQRTPIDPIAVFDEAERLSARFAATIGCRTLDILHVAAAIVLGAAEFISMDQRQRALAAAAGLRVKP